MKYNLLNKIILVTGASKGIGKAISIKLAENGARVMLLSRNENELEENCASLRKSGYQCIYKAVDVSNLDDLLDAVEYAKNTWGTIDGLINNAGITDDNLIVRMKPSSFNQVIDVNLKGVFNGIKSVTKPMMKNNNGRIINITSVVAHTGNKGQANYAASKAGVIGLTKSAAKELASKNITVNAIAPGYIETNMTENLNQINKEKLLDSIPLNRLGQPDDIASMVCFLLTNQAQYITGQTINIDGGMVMQ